MKTRHWIAFIIIWLIWLWLCEPPKKWEDLTAEERLMMDIEATAWGIW